MIKGLFLSSSNAVTFFIPYMQAKGGGLAFIQGNQSSSHQNVSDWKPSPEFLVYMNEGHEYVVFDPNDSDAPELGLTRPGLVAPEETGGASSTNLITSHHLVILVHVQLSARNLKNLNLPKCLMPPIFFVELQRVVML